jgi:alkylation response protein AidB-like acyl-CoA dehydrogenase
MTSYGDYGVEVESWLRNRLPPSWIRAIDDGDTEALAVARKELDTEKWWRDLADAGYVAPTWPMQYGGLDLSATEANQVGRALSKFKAPRFDDVIAITLAGPAILQWGTEQQKTRLLPPIIRQEEHWCQLFSEPGHGSDLAGLSTRADRDGDSWIVRGQKVWTSFAHRSTWGLLLARTNPDVPKHQGITVFLLPMHQPGVIVRPLRHLTGDAEFNEVFLDDAVIPDDLRLGEVDAGWTVTTSILMNERLAVAGSGAALPGTTTGRSISTLLRHHAPVADPTLRQRMVRLYIEDRVIEFTNLRSAAKRRAGERPGPEGSITKLFASEHTQRLQELAVDLEGPGGQAWDPEDRWRANTAWSFLRVRAKTIAGGTSEIQRNVLGERVLGLPREAASDRSVAWKDIPRS